MFTLLRSFTLWIFSWFCSSFNLNSRWSRFDECTKSFETINTKSTWNYVCAVCTPLQWNSSSYLWTVFDQNTKTVKHQTYIVLKFLIKHIRCAVFRMKASSVRMLRFYRAFVRPIICRHQFCCVFHQQLERQMGIHEILFWYDNSFPIQKCEYTSEFDKIHISPIRALQISGDSCLLA